MVNAEELLNPALSLAFANYRLFVDDLARAPMTGQTIINTLNPHSFYIAEHDRTFRLALETADILLPDGVGIVWACRFLKRQAIHRISGMDLFIYLLRSAAANTAPERRRIFFLGASDATLEKIKDRVRSEYPSLEIGTFSPPFKEIFSEHDRKAMLYSIREFNPHILFVGMTAPKQEKWVYENKDDIRASIICSIGAVFDYYAGTIKRPGAFWRRIGLEWFIRFLREPKRLWKRNLISGPFFIFRVFQLKLNR